jgi:hypothetical protein
MELYTKKRKIESQTNQEAVTKAKTESEFSTNKHMDQGAVGSN